MRWLPLLLSLATAALLAPALAGALRRSGFVRENYRGVEVAFPGGIAIVAAALVALAPLALLEEIAGVQALEPAPAAVTYVLGVALLGLVDDVFGGGPSPRGWRGHAAAAARGELSTGALKAAGSLGLALYVLSGAPFLKAGTLLSAAVLVLATHVFNLLDLRPGRSIKSFVLLGAGLALATLDLGPLWALGVFVGPILVLLPLDLREVAMLGDTGASVVGAVAGLWLVLALAPLGQAVAAALMAALAVYGELRSISAAVERLPLVRHLDSLGRVRRPVPDSGTRG